MSGPVLSPVVSPVLAAGTVDAENPWPGLAAFREADRERLTILFGLSGLGKTSLLQAGLFPRLRDESILPVPIRLDYSASRRPLPEQIRAAVARAAADAGIEAPPPRAGETLWESFHRQGAEFWSPRNRLVTPLLVLDQFEEIFTLGQQDAACARETAALVSELAALCDGSPPRAVRDRLDAEPSAIRDFFFDRHPYKLLFSLREDFLPDLEALRGQIGALAHNRMRLLGMKGRNALDVVTQAGSLELVDAATAEKIVRFVASQDEEDVPLAGLDVEPALLSFVCRELNTERRLQGARRITAGLLEGTRETIFVGFYERSVGDLDPRVRAFIEDRLLTKSGFRSSEALENALEAPGIDAGVIRTLTDRRLLRIEDRGGLPRIELTHDVLTGAIRSSRDTRRQREAQAKAEAARREAEAREEETRRKLRRSRMVIAALGLAILTVIGFAAWALNAQKKAQQALARAEVERALYALQERHPAPALAYLARAVRLDPENLPARGWLTNLLVHSAWLLPAKELQKVDAVRGLRFSQDGRRVLVFDETAAWVWETATGRRIGPPIRFEHPRAASLSRDGRLLFLLDQEDNGRLWETKTGEPLGPAAPLGGVVSFQLSPDGLLLAVTRNDGTADLLETRTGSLLHRLALQEQRITEVSFSLQDSVLVTVSRPGSWPAAPEEIHLWDTREEELLSEPTVPPRRAYFQQVLTVDPEHPSAMKLSADGSLVLADVQNSIVLFDRSSGAVYATGGAGREVSSFEASQDGHVVLTLSSDRTVRVWSTLTHRSLFEPLEGIAEAHLSADGRSLVTASTEGQVRLWTVHPGRLDSGWITFDSGTYRFAISPQGDKIASFSPGKLRLWDVASLRPDGDPLPAPFLVKEARFSADGTTLAACGGKALRVWDLRARRAADGSFEGGLRALDLSPDGKRLVTGSERNSAQIWNLSDLSRPARLLAHDGGVNMVRFSPDGRSVLTASADRSAALWDAGSGELIGERMRHGGPVLWADFSPDGRRIATTSRDKVVHLWSGPRNAPEPSLVHAKPVFYAQFSSGGQRMLTTTDDGAVWVWDLEASPRLLAGPLTPDRRQLSQVADSGDGQRFAILYPNPPEARIWSLAGDPLGDSVLRVGADAWKTAQFIHEGQRLVIAGDDEALIWDVPLVPPREAGELADLAEAVAGSAVAANGKLAALPDPIGLLDRLRTRTAGAALGAASAPSLTRWFLADPWESTISPLSQVTVQDWIGRLLAEGSEASRKTAEGSYPGHPLLAPRP
jgi:WD40 repeat protein